MASRWRGESVALYLAFAGNAEVGERWRLHRFSPLVLARAATTFGWWPPCYTAIKLSGFVGVIELLAKATAKPVVILNRDL